ncbi:nitronate monooxygenase [Salipaludibacillus sp. LMS25]|jgi:nitronate monooxygenase|uniref:NAD(P)H-dependent flavin oxidoreductase n=1 Tax=Salipaludibacillus sp. LMS25 TaxID=2924031 RepID=UPI0020D0BFA0|nr:nitronate monooxygenase [Salipaludibacillus sp. LMS25]UTR14923.1 nitronate monooxygenase [Salipaludibacillus sp. LMS25]
MLSNDLTDMLQIDYPIIQAPMAGGITTPELVSSVSEQGALGSIGAGYMTPKSLHQHIRDVRKRTSNPFSVNVFVPNEFNVSIEEVERVANHLRSISKSLGVKGNGRSLPTPASMKRNFEEQIHVILEEKVPICSFTFGVPAKEVVAKLKKENVILMGTATTVNEAILLENKGMDMIIIQGSEAGGHRGHFLAEREQSMIGLISLIPQVADRVTVPVIAAGGIMDARGLVAARYLGASAVQMGTAFLTCAESGAHPTHKEAILYANEDHIVLTNAFSGKWARGIKNTFIDDMKDYTSILPFPVQNTLTSAIRKASADQHNPAYMSLWTGQSPRLATDLSAARFIQQLVQEVKDITR